jgi:anti-sigma B factor antagonist
VSVAVGRNVDWQPFRCEVLPERDAVRVRPVGEIDLATSDEVAAALDEMREAGFRRVVLDLSEVTFVDSSGIRAIVEARRAADRDRVALVVVPGPPAVQRVFTLTGVADLVFRESSSLTR